MKAFARVVYEKIINKKKWDVFDGLTLTIPPSEDMYDYPHYHAVVGQKLLLVELHRWP